MFNRKFTSSFIAGLVVTLQYFYASFFSERGKWTYTADLDIYEWRFVLLPTHV